MLFDETTDVASQCGWDFCIVSIRDFEVAFNNINNSYTTNAGKLHLSRDSVIY